MSVPALGPSFLLPADADQSILADFIIEAGEHLESSDQNLLTLETEPANRSSLDAVFRAFHSIKGVAGFLGLEGIKSLSHEAENLLDKIRVGEVPLAPKVMDCVFDCVTFLKGTIADLKRGANEGDDLRCQAASAALRARIEALLSGKAFAIGESPAAGEAAPSGSAVLPGSGADPEARAADFEGPQPDAQVSWSPAAPAEPAPKAEAAGKTPAPSLAGAVKDSVKVDSARLDRLLNAIGELVIAESMVLGAPELKRSLSPALVQKIGQLDKITRELQEMGTSLRMVPIRPTFQKMQRLVRDLSKNSGKAVDFVVEGEETELDKTVVEKIGDPLVHMLRNSLDHGIESDPEARARRQAPHGPRPPVRLPEGRERLHRDHRRRARPGPRRHPRQGPRARLVARRGAAFGQGDLRVHLRGGLLDRQAGHGPFGPGRGHGRR
jgi:two-component system chemotaxis sensor kinase CheA